jgi:hypothetical protein
MASQGLATVGASASELGHAVGTGGRRLSASARQAVIIKWKYLAWSEAENPPVKKERPRQDLNLRHLPPEGYPTPRFNLPSDLRLCSGERSTRPQFVRVLAVAEFVQVTAAKWRALGWPH